MHIHPFDTFHYCPKCGGKFEEHNEKSYRCEQCGFVYYFNPSAATVAVIVNERDELLVCRRAKEPAKGTLDLPGGFCDMYETAEEGVAREVREETGPHPALRPPLVAAAERPLHALHLAGRTDLH